MTHSDDEIRRGYAFGISCYLLWGIMPIYFKFLLDITPVEIIAHRIGWSVLLLLVLALARRELASILLLMGNRRLVAALATSALLIAVNWLVYVWAVAHQHILAASLGYFLNPLVSVALGVVVLKERLRPMQMVAIGLALLGVVMLAFSALDTLWVTAMLAFSFAFYGLIRKVTPVDALPGLTIETLILFPVAGLYLGWLAVDGTLDFGQHLLSTLLLPLSGVLTSVPLLLFAQAARRLPLATIGLLQYVTPSIQFMVGYLLYDEPLGSTKLFSFLLIWIALAIFTYDTLGHLRRMRESRSMAAG